jgi:HK97 family phage portal protein
VTAEYTLPQARWSPRNAATHFHEGYRINSAVFACTRAVANGFAEAPLMVYADESKEEALPDHPLQKLIKRPNPYMGEDEWWKYVMTYAPIGGNAYGKIVANNGGEPTELWPYHDMVMFPVPSRTRWIEYYAYTVDNGRNVVEIPTEEIVHFKWAIDPDCPWKGMSALSPVSREVDTDNELTRYLKALLQNDAVTRGALIIPAGTCLSPPPTRKPSSRTGGSSSGV